MFFTIEKLKARLDELVAAAIRESRPVSEVQHCVAPGTEEESAMAAPPPADSPVWTPIRVGDRWGVKPGDDPAAPVKTLGWGIPANGGSTHWLRVRVQVPAEWRGQSVFLRLHWKDTGQSSLEAIAYLDGKAVAGIDEFHPAVKLPASAHDGVHEVLLRMYVPFPQAFDGLTLQRRDESVFQLAHFFRAALGAIETYRDSDPIRHTLLSRLNDAYNLLDLREGWGSQRFADSAETALEALRLGFAGGLERGQRPKIVSTGHAHMDVAWLWPLWRTRQKIAHTVASALHLMERYPDYHFSMSQPQTFHYLKHDDPELYARLKQRAAEGRFEPVGMMWLEPDCNIPSGESLVRQLVHGAKFFDAEFGQMAHVVWLPDVFGYSAALPQLMRLMGIKCFMTTKISWNQFNRMPVDTFRWRGIDGSEVLTHFVTATEQPVKHPAEAQFYTYVGRMSSAEAFGTWNHYRQKAINDELLYIYGWGDGGGGPTEEMLETANLLKDLPGFPQIELGRIESYFERLYKRVWNNPELPTWVGELYLEYHRGTYTSQSHTKQANRTAELIYREAEWLNGWATLLGATNLQSALDDGWQITLLNQFHDILPGSSVPLVYKDSNAQYAEVHRIGQTVRGNALESVLKHVPTTGASAVILNTLPWERHDLARLVLHDDAPPPILTATDGTTVRSQIVEVYGGGRELLVQAAAPSYGYAVLKAGTQVASTPSKSSLQAAQATLRNDLVAVTFDERGEIASFRDLRNGRELIAPGTTGNQLVAYEDRPMFWEAWDVDAYYEEKPYPVREITGWKVVESGPLRAAIEITRRLGSSTIRQRISLTDNSPRLDFETEVEWQERQTFLRALFPLNLNTTRATCDIQFGAVERPAHRNTSWDWARFEVCAHKWVDMSEGGYGVALLNNGKYGHSLRDNVIGLSLLKGAIAPDPDADRGVHRFTYSLLPHEGDWRQGQVVRRAYELNAPQQITLRTDGGTAQPALNAERHSFLNTATDHIVVETIKTAYDGDGLIVRLYEAHNQRGQAEITFARSVASAVEVDLMEREIGTVSVAGAQVKFAVRPYEVKTLRVRF